METIKVNGKYYVSMDDLREDADNKEYSYQCEILFYQEIIRKINKALFIDAKQYFDKDDMFSHFDFRPEDYKIYSEYVDFRRNQSEINKKDDIIHNLQISNSQLKGKIEKLKMGMDKRVLLYDTDFTKIRNMKKIIDEFADDMMERKKVLIDEG